METFTADLVNVTDNLKEAYSELLICHKGKFTYLRHLILQSVFCREKRITQISR